MLQRRGTRLKRTRATDGTNVRATDIGKNHGANEHQHVTVDQHQHRASVEHAHIRHRQLQRFVVGNIRQRH